MPLITLSVNTTIDENDGISSGQGISLRDAILAANADPTNEYVIVLQGGSTHTLSLSNSNGDEEGGLTGDLDIAAGARISIVTSDGSKATINAAGIAGGDRAFDVLANGRLSLNNVEITGGNSQDSGGAISIAKDATVVVENSIIKNNTAAIDGGAIYNKGNLSVSQSSIEDNKALVGSGIANYNSATVSNSSITGNDAISGGAVYNRDSFTLTNTTVTGNTATFGGAFYNVGDDLNITGSTISDNDAFVAGGGVYNNGRAKIEQSNLTDNISGVRGGGIINLESGNLVVLSSNVSGGESKTGGGIDNTGTFAFINSTLNNNIAENGGGLNNSSSGKATLINATIGGNGALSNGGGIANSAQLNITNGTIANNTSDGDGNGSGVGGGIFNAGGSATLKNTLVAQNVGNDLSGSFRGNANNLIGNTIGASGTIGTGSDIINGTPFIGPLQDNGNGILTYMPLVGSSAIDKGNNAFLPQDTFDIDGDGDVSEIIPLDSKGGNRIVNGAVDIGAIEFVPENRGIPNITVNPVSGLFTNENGSTAQFTVVLNSQPTSDVTIALNSSDTTEGTISTSAITFTPANWNVAQTVTVTGADDDFADGSVPFTIVTAAAVSADAGYNGLNAADVSATNNDNETAGITVSQTSGLVTDENGSTAQFTVVLNSQPTSDVTIALNSSDTTEGTISTSSITFTPANWNIAQTVTVEGINDPDVDGDIAYTIVTAATVSADSNYNGLDVADISLVNNDNDGAPVTVEAPTIPADKPGVISFDKLPDLDFSTFNPFGSPSEDGSDSEPAFRIDRVGDLPSNGGLRAAPQLAAATASEGIKGSFVKDSTTDNLTFAKTGEPMGSGIYQMTLNTDGMLDEDGNPIDGDGDGNPGGDFVLEFPVDNRGKRAFSLEDFVAGPGQSVKLPSSGGRGIDIDIDDATGLTKIEFDFVFDEDILGVSGVSRGANLPDSWNISSELESPGRLQVVLEGTEAIQGGAAQLVNVVADVLPTAVYGSSGLLQLDRIELNDGAIGSVGDVGVHSVGKLGDLNNDGKYTSLDASLLSRVVQGIDSSFATNPLIDGNILGDTNSTDSLTSEDALSVAKKVVGIPQNDIL
jgi:hypothetical protein